MSKNNNLITAKKNKKDEFYTQIEDIEKELSHYKEQLKGKVIYCNCDDPNNSEFWNYFKENFDKLELEKLVATSYGETEVSYKTEYDGKYVIETPLNQNGDFRNTENIEILKESDILITNPPFSLFREYIAQLTHYNKKFIIIGSQNAVTYNEVFSLLKENKIWLGYRSGSYKFEIPEDYITGNIITEDAKRYVKLGNITWYTNIDTTKRKEELVLFHNYNEIDYPTYDNYNAINVNKVKEIPCDYYGAMGVPITFMDRYNPSQFEILGQTGVDIKLNKGRPYINGKRLYARILVKRK